MTTTTDSITSDQIRSLSTEAAEHGDLAMVKVCGLALNGSAKDRAECAKVISDAEAQADIGYVLIEGDYIMAAGATADEAIAEYIIEARPLTDDDVQRPLTAADLDARDLLRVDLSVSGTRGLRRATRRLIAHVAEVGGDTTWDENIDGVCDIVDLSAEVI